MAIFWSLIVLVVRLQYTQALEVALEDAPTKTRDERCKVWKPSLCSILVERWKSFLGSISKTLLVDVWRGTAWTVWLALCILSYWGLRFWMGVKSVRELDLGTSRVDGNQGHRWTAGQLEFRLLRRAYEVSTRTVRFRWEHFGTSVKSTFSLREFLFYVFSKIKNHFIPRELRKNPERTKGKE